ncbi:hypothetical protein CPS_2288 [Colwellia psychrerythraea 34H]|uniref:Uncharacterized protein n=1 Tax=Colwellia psychrerythraea (strain 34H / ATCC BAA-681) TaxID=167879 RepID=Q482K9_COLP3|nr:hypothetical protein CPS_2288 [Colwellia psychrerythraea 34H]
MYELSYSALIKSLYQNQVKFRQKKASYNFYNWLFKFNVRLFYGLVACALLRFTTSAIIAVLPDD